ncbi:CoA-transferase family III [Frankia sp. EI5c]|uniref:CoA transferase n=1 Tax=Frankia sp. EI5c TaxID=683316 RepID=UPI0007C33F86|nr:CoA transferase [Frankia sp. EI5c]OAA23972.1 CoA-transferase family III [Frankia sp. EI5c]
MTGSFKDELARVLRAAGLPLPAECDPDRDGEHGSGAAARDGSGAAAWAGSALDWAESGLMWLTGQPGQPPVVPAAPVLGRARAAGRLLLAVSTRLGTPVAVDVAELLGGRAALLGLRRGGTVSANGSCRLLRTADGWVAVNLPREDDVDAVPALLGAMPADILATAPLERGPGGAAGPAGRTGSDPLAEAWAALTIALPGRRGRDLVELAWLLGLPLAALPAAPPAAPPAPVRISGGTPAEPGLPVSCPQASSRPPSEPPAPGGRVPLVVDLSSLWAGPLAAHLLGRMGMRVLKVESTHRPDGARRGDPDFFHWLHAGHDGCRLDFTDPAGRAALHRLVERAEVVIEGSRPRALAQLGLDADRWVAARPGRVWLSITGYGRQAAAAGPGAGPVAFGDDAAVAGGLVAWSGAVRGGGVPVFCGDAIADPLTGLYGALAVALCRAGGRGALLDLAMRDVAAFVAHPGPAASSWSVTGSDRSGWTVHEAGRRTPVRPPRAPRAAGAPRRPHTRQPPP